MPDYASRLQVPLVGDAVTKLYTKSGVHVATGYVRVVIGARGPYVEFDPSQLIQSAFNETDKRHFYYIELRSVPDNVKAYFQVSRVDYADYVPGLCYVSPFELYDESGCVLIKPLR